LFAVAILTGHNLRVPRGEHVHVMVAGFFNVAAFQILSAFAQLSGATSRAVVITYSMPIWATVLSRLMLGERLNGIRMFAFWLCVSGLATLVYPLFAEGFPPSVLLSFACALSWAFATVYMKWVKATIKPLANAAWQLLFGFLFIAAGTFLFDGSPQLCAAARRNRAGDSLCRPVRRRARAFSVVVNRRTAADNHGVDRRAAGAGGRRHRLDDISGRASNHQRHRRLRFNIRGSGLRAVAAERQAHRNAGVTQHFCVDCIATS
jgi:hypothetical protein